MPGCPTLFLPRILMLREIVDDFVKGHRIVITSSSNNGASSFSLYLANQLARDDSLIIYYNPSSDIDRDFIKKYYPLVIANVLWISGRLDSFIEFLSYIEHDYDCLIVDPGDALMINKQLVAMLGKFRKRGATLLLTSQIRQDPHKGWAPYSTVERTGAFDYSIWLTNVTGPDRVFKTKYVDIHKDIRSGNNFIAREIAKFTHEGSVVE